METMRKFFMVLGFLMIVGFLGVEISRENETAEILDAGTRYNQRKDAERVAAVAPESVAASRPNSTSTHGSSDSFRDCPGCPKMVELAAGEFWMGADVSDNVAYAHEKPRHKVKVRAYSLGKYEVTQGQWQAVMGYNPSYFQQCGDDCPVEQVSFDEVQEFIKQLNAKTGKTYRLPTEAEWEYACRAGGDFRYCGGDDPKTVAWYHGNSGETTHSVGKKKANAWGLYDMSGNTDEWTCSASIFPYGSGEELSCSGDAGTARAFRGGFWGDNASGIRSTARSGVGPDVRGKDSGFRLALSPSE